MPRYNVIGPIVNRQSMAIGNNIRELQRLQDKHGQGKWRKCKGKATIIMTSSGDIRRVELHWYEAHGIGRVEEKIKRDVK